MQKNPRPGRIDGVKIKLGSDLRCSGEPVATRVADARNICRFLPLDARSGLPALTLRFWKAAGLQEPPNWHSKYASDLFNRRQPDAFAAHGFNVLVVPR